jgi:hypothetical protein
MDIRKTTEAVEREEAERTRHTIPPVALAELFAGKTPSEWRTTYAGAFEWGPDVGKEAVPD